MKVRPTTGSSTSEWGPRHGFQKLSCLYDGLTALYATLCRKAVDTTDDPAFEHVRTVADAGAVSRNGRHRHAVLFRPKQTSDPRFISTDAAVMMNGGANAGFGREVRRVNRGIRTANNDGTLCFRRKLCHAVNHQNRNVHWDHSLPPKLSTGLRRYQAPRFSQDWPRTSGRLIVLRLPRSACHPSRGQCDRPQEL